MKLSTLTMFLISSLVVLTACSNEMNHTSNKVFENSSSTSKKYKDELAKQLKLNSNELTYTFNKYLENNGHEYLEVQFKGDDFEATGLVLVNNWNKLEGIKRTKGLSYSGAELRGLAIGIEESPSGANLIYKDLQNIVD